MLKETVQTFLFCQHKAEHKFEFLTEILAYCRDVPGSPWKPVFCHCIYKLYFLKKNNLASSNDNVYRFKAVEEQLR